MAGALRKTMVYLGLAEDDGHDEYDDEFEGYAEDEALEAPRERHAQVTALPTRRPVAEIVRTPATGGLSRITTIHPRTYNEAKTIGENFRDGTPVIMNLTDMDDADAKRLVDFAAGLVFGLHGAIERVTSKVFLLSPATVTVNAEDPVVAPGRTVFNQS